MGLFKQFDADWIRHQLRFTLLHSFSFSPTYQHSLQHKKTQPSLIKTTNQRQNVWRSSRFFYKRFSYVLSTFSVIRRLVDLLFVPPQVAQTQIYLLGGYQRQSL